MKKLSDYKWKKNDCVHIDNEKDWKILVPESSRCYNSWGFCKENSYYRPFDDSMSTFNYAEENNYTIHQAKDFLEESFESGEEVYADGFVQAKGWYIGKDRDNNYIVEDENGIIFSFKKIYKINHAKLEAIETIKRLMSEHNINISEL